MARNNDVEKGLTEAFLDLSLSEVTAHAFLVEAFTLAGEEPPTKHLASNLYQGFYEMVREFDPKTGERFAEGSGEVSRVDHWSVRDFLAHKHPERLSHIKNVGKKTRNAFMKLLAIFGARPMGDEFMSPDARKVLTKLRETKE